MHNKLPSKGRKMARLERKTKAHFLFKSKYNKSMSKLNNKKTITFYIMSQMSDKLISTFKLVHL